MSCFFLQENLRRAMRLLYLYVGCRLQLLPMNGGVYSPYSVCLPRAVRDIVLQLQSS